MIRFSRLLVAAACISFAPALLPAQGGLFLDRTYIVRMAPEMGLMYEGQTALPLFLYSDMDSLYASLHDLNGGWSTARTLLVTPMFRIRQLTDKAAASSPVRTPSFMPKLTAQFLAVRQLEPRPIRRENEFPVTALVLGLEGTFGHYSNGQAGCFRANQRQKVGGKGDCEPDPNATPGSDTLNTVDGSFSTWYFRVQTHARIAQYDESRLVTAVTLSAGIDWHPAFLQPIGGMDTALAAVYGRQRPFWGLEVARGSEWDCPKIFALGWVPCGAGRLKVKIHAEYIGTRPPGVSPVATTTELLWSFRRYAGFGAIVRYHHGQDYYNIALGHQLNVTQFGFTFDLERDDPTPTGR